MVVYYLKDYKGLIQNIGWSKSRIDMESRQEILSNLDNYHEHQWLVMDRLSIIIKSQLVWAVELMIKLKVKAYN